MRSEDFLTDDDFVVRTLQTQMREKLAALLNSESADLAEISRRSGIDVAVLQQIKDGRVEISSADMAKILDAAGYFALENELFAETREKLTLK